MNKILHPLLLLILLIPGLALADAAKFSGDALLLGKHTQILEDPESTMNLAAVMKSSKFIASKDETPNMGLSQSTFWIRFAIENNSREENLVLELAHPMIHSAELHDVSQANAPTQSFRETDDFNSRPIKHPNLAFTLKIKPGQTKHYYLRVKGYNQVILPLILRGEDSFFESSLLGETINGIFSGIIVVMVLYNLFIYFSVKDRSYLFYVLYVLAVGLAQTSLSGYAYKYLWPGLPAFNSVATIWFSGFAGVFAMLFVKNFLQVPEKWPFGVKILNFIIVLYSSTGLLSLAGFELLSFRAVDVAGGLGAIGLYVIGIRLLREKNKRTAILFLVAWTLFLFGLFLIVLRNIAVLPYNLFTSNTMQFGSIMEIVLLSIALADKINIFKKEREESQAEALRQLEVNRDIIQRQNESLELKVQERTVSLQKSNQELNETLERLTAAQTQLIESEKMASLGQLTAGIAHEINNPINFVSSNIRPLRRDIDDLIDILSSYDQINNVDSLQEIKQKMQEVQALKDDLDLEYIKDELDMLLKGMEDGAQRTVEIVKGLKIFSRLDDTDLNLFSINEGLESTLVILNYQLGTHIRVVKELGELPRVEGYGGKMNQVFMNILTNSIYALNKRQDDGQMPTIWVKTQMKDENHVTISLKDNGTGMTPEVKAKIFDPFFTTKDVGEGTGLGLSIVFQIIGVHQGDIDVITAPGQGTEFLITLPIKKNLPIPIANE